MRRDHRTDTARRVVARQRQGLLAKVANAAALVTRVEALAFTKKAAETAPEDLGLRAFYRVASEAFGADPTGTWSYDDLMALSAPARRQFPRSAASTIVEQIVDNSLGDIAPQHRDAYMRDVARLANLVTDQASYEDVVTAHGLDGNDLHCIRARAMIRALAMPHTAQEVGPPHEEAAEQVQQTESPNTGEPIVLEVAPKSPEGPVPSNEESMHSDLLPVSSEGPFSVVGQLGDFAPSDDMPSLGEHDVMVTVDDPTEPGAKIDIILRPHETEDDLGEMSDEDFESRLPEAPSMDGEPENPFEPKAAAKAAWRPFAVISATESGCETIARFKARSMSAALRRVASVAMRNGVDMLTAAVSTASRPAARGLYSIVDLGDTQLHVVAADAYDVTAVEQPEMQGAPSHPDPSALLSDAAAGEGSVAKTSRITPDVARARAAELGLSAAALESMLLGDFEVKRAGWRIALTVDDTIEVGAIGKRAEVFPIRKMDEAIANFQAVVAALSPAEKKAYALSFKVPGRDEAERRVNARKVFADARQVASPIHVDADLATGMVTLYYETPPEEPARNRIAAVCRDKYGILEITAQALARPNSPFTSAPPVVSQPAGAPAQPMQAPQQQMATGTNALKDMVERHTDPMKPIAAKPTKNGPGQDLCPLCGEDRNHPSQHGNHNCARPGERPRPRPDKKGQLDDAAPPMMDPSMDAGGGQPSMPMDVPMGSAPPMLPGDAGGMAMGGGAGMSPEDQEAVSASLTHYRNKRMGPMEAMSQFTRDYGDFLDRFGKQGDDRRAAVEAEIVKTMGEIWTQPAVLKAAQMPLPKVSPRVIPQGGSPSAPKPALGAAPDEMSIDPGAVQGQQDMQGQKPKSMDLDETEGGRESF